MGDLVVTVPKHFWFDWIAEGDAAGEPTTGTEWGFWLGTRRPKAERGDRLYIVAWGRVRGYSPITRVVQDANGRWVVCREGGAVAVTIPEFNLRGFQGFRYRWWGREQEREFPEWQTDGLPPKKVERAREQLGLPLLDMTPCENCLLPRHEHGKRAESCPRYETIK